MTATTKPMLPWIGAKEFAAILGVCPSTIRRWLREKRIPRPTMPGAHPKWHRKFIRDWIETCKENALDEGTPDVEPSPDIHPRDNPQPRNP